MSEKGFTLLEVLISILILAVTLTAFMGGISQVLMLSGRMEETSQVLAGYEKLLFELETGMRADLVAYGGQGKLNDKLTYEIKSKPQKVNLRELKLTMSWHGQDNGWLMETLLMEGDLLT